MRRILRTTASLFAVPAALVLLSACGEQSAAPAGAAPQASPSSPGSGPSGELYSGIATVLESEAHGPMLCESVMESYPPQCGGGPVIVGWDWSEVTAESARGTTWGTYELTGVLDDGRLVLSEPPAIPSDTAGAHPGGMHTGGTEADSSETCREPEGGWPVPDPQKTGETALAAAGDLAREMETGTDGFAGHWRGDGPQDGPALLVYAFTGDPGAHEARIREVWGGPLCLTAREHSHAELTRIQQRITRDFPKVWGVGVDPSRNVVVASVTDAPGTAQAAMDERFGPGVVVVEQGEQPSIPLPGTD